LASKVIKGIDGKQARGRNRGRRGGRGPADGNSGGEGTSKADSSRPFSLGLTLQKYQKYNQQVNDALSGLGVSKPATSNSRLTTKFTGLKSALIVLFELQRIEAQFMYELQVLTEQKKLLSNDSGEKTHNDTIFNPSISNNGAPRGEIVDLNVGKFGLDEDEGKDSDDDDDPYAEEDDGDGDDFPEV